MPGPVPLTPMFRRGAVRTTFHDWDEMTSYDSSAPRLLTGWLLAKHEAREECRLPGVVAPGGEGPLRRQIADARIFSSMAENAPLLRIDGIVHDGARATIYRATRVDDGVTVIDPGNASLDDAESAAADATAHLSAWKRNIGSVMRGPNGALHVRGGGSAQQSGTRARSPRAPSLAARHRMALTP